MAFEHKSGLPFAYDRAEGHDEQKSLVFYGDRSFIQGAELNEVQTVLRGNIARVGRMMVKDGTRIERASAIVNVSAGTVTLTDGSIYVAGDVYPVAAATLSGVPMTGRVEIGVRLKTQYRTHEDDPTLLGLVPGSVAEGEPGAAREVASISWARNGDSQPGTFFSVYILENGTILDQEGPSVLAPAMEALKEYDRPNGNYVVHGNLVTALGLDAGAQHFSVEQGEANINGMKRTRYAALRHAEPQDWDELAVPGETKTYPGGASYTFEVDFAPIGQVNSILLTKERTVTVTRGSVTGGADALPNTSVTSIVSVVQGGTTFATSAYQLTANNVDWSPAGGEPATGSTYQVTYRYRDLVTPTNQTYKSITVAGGASGGDIIVAYTQKLPRIDRLCLKEDGSTFYLKGISARANALPPAVPDTLLNLCQIRNDWISTPEVINDRTEFLTRDEMRKLFDWIPRLIRLGQLERIKSGIDRREPTAKLNMFVDPFLDDTYRDSGETQDGSVVGGEFTLSITPTFYSANLSAAVKLDHVEEVLISQTLKTGCVKINPYANFTPLPGVLKLVPAADHWSVKQTVWTSPVTQEFNRGVARTANSPLQSISSADTVVDRQQVAAEFLRQIQVSFTISGFGAGEVLTGLTFDGRNVKPAGTQTANASGVISGTFTIPSNVTAGTKIVQAQGAGGTYATALFEGQGIINIDVMRRVTTIERWDAVPPPAPSGSVISTPTLVRDGGNGGRGRPDPQAQMFAVPEQRQVLGVDFHICAVGNQAKRLIVDQVTTDNGYPTTDIVAEADVPMTGAVVGWKSARWKLPVSTSPDRSHAFVVKTDDNVHSVSIAKLGGFDPETQQFITRHPYVIGPRFDSVNAETWTAHQDEVLAFRIVAARYPVTTKTVNLGSFALVDCSDLQVRAAVEIPGPGCNVTFEVIRPNGTVYRLAPMQVVQLNEFITETVQLRAVLTGTEKLSPILYPAISLIAGRIETTAVYVSRNFALSSGSKLTAYLKSFLPSGATVSMSYSVDGAAWQSLPYVSAEQLQFPNWTERKFEKTGLSGTNVRLKISATGGPGARFTSGDFAAAIM